MWPPLQATCQDVAPTKKYNLNLAKPGIEAGFCHVKFYHKNGGLEQARGRSRGDVAPTKNHMAKCGPD